MITPDYKQDEIRALWQKTLDLHKEMKLGDKITHPMREEIAQLSVRLFELGTDIGACRIYVPESKPEITQSLLVPTAKSLEPLHPTTNPTGE
jgi:hypothetical protein